MNQPPNCPNCGKRLVFVALALQSAGVMYKTWQCSCLYEEEDDQSLIPGDIVTRINQARERGQEVSVSMVELEGADEEE